MLSYNVTGLLELVLFYPSLALPGKPTARYILALADAAVSAPLASGNSNEEDWYFFLRILPPTRGISNEGLQPDLI